MSRTCSDSTPRAFLPRVPQNVATPGPSPTRGRRRLWPALLLGVVPLLPPGALAASPPVPVGGEFHVNTYTTSYQSRPAVGHEPNGAFVVVWHSNYPGGPGQDGSGSGIFGQRFDGEGGELGSEFQVNVVTTSNQTEQSVAVAPDGSFVVVWSSSHADGSGEGVFGRLFDADGDPVGGDFPVNTHTVSNQRFPHVSQDPRGEGFAVTWSSFSQDSDQYGVYAQRFGPDGTPVGGEFQVHDTTAVSQGNSAVSHAPSGDFVIVWETLVLDARLHDIYARRFDSDGNAVGEGFQVNAYTTDSQALPAVSHGPAGDFVVIWNSLGQDGSGYGVFGRRYTGEGGEGPEFQVSTYTLGQQASTLSGISHGPGGEFTVAWESPQDGSSVGVFLQTFDAEGSPVGEEMQVNTYTTNIQSIPSVSADGTGRFVVAWSSYFQDPDPFRGIFAQRFLVSTPLIFADGFETGDTTAWSSSTP